MERVGLFACLGLMMAAGVSCTNPAPQQAMQQADAPQQSPAFADSSPLSPQAKLEAVKLNELPPVAVPHTKKPPIDHSGRKEVGDASYYSHSFTNKKMANGEKFNPNDNVAASKTLPLGTTAKVTNLETGKSEMVKVEDRGPHVDGRVLDVSPKVAQKLDMKHEGVAKVEVKPVAVPTPDGGVKLGAGAADTPAPVVDQAVKTTQGLAQGQ